MSKLQEKLTSWRSKTGKAFGQVMQIINRDPILVEELKNLTNFLDPYYSAISIQQRFYHLWFNFYELEKCPYCSNPKKFAKIPKFSTDRYGIKPTNPVNYYGTCLSETCSKKYNLDKTQQTLMEKYNTTNIMEIPGVMEKLKSNNLEKYGSEWYTSTQSFKDKTKKTFEEKYGMHPTKLKETQDKKKKTNIEKYGQENPLNNPEVREKSNRTNQERYGGNSSMCSNEIKEKSKQTNQQKRGTDWYTQSEDFKLKFRKTMLERYGVEHAFHYTDHYEKSLDTSYKKKIFVFPSGRIEKIQGYEHLALSRLLDLGYKEEDIIVSNKVISEIIGSIWYNDHSGKRRRYYPDILIISENRIIEVKSEYTYTFNRSINEFKRSGVLSKGLNFEFWIFDRKGNLAIK